MPLPFIEEHDFRPGQEYRDPDLPPVLPPYHRWIVRFPSFGEFADAAAERSQFPSNRQRTSRRTVTVKRDPWYGTATFDDAIKLWEWGWEEGGQMVAKITEGTVDVLGSLIERPNIYYRDDPGIGIDIARYIEGEPECFYDIVSEMVEGDSRRHMRVVFNASAAAGISTKVMMAKGAAVAAVVNLLDLAGYGVELDLVDTYAGTGDAVEIYVKVKGADEPLDPVAVAYAIAHPATTRRLSFGVAELFPLRIMDRVGIGGAYGYPCDSSEQGDLYIGPSKVDDPRWVDPEQAMRWVVRTLKAQGISLKDEAKEYL